MSARAFFILVCTLACLATLTCVLIQGRQLANLRTEQQRLVSQSLVTKDSSRESPVAQPAVQTVEQHPAVSPSRELLRLRNEVTRLSIRRRELFGVTNENVRLRSQLRDHKAKASAAAALAPGYILRSKAQRVGFSTPEDAMQSYLWAMQNRDINGLLQALTPDSAEQTEAQLRESGSSTNEFFQRTEALVGMAILERRQLANGSIEADVQIVPGIPALKFRFQLIGGQWKIETPH
jgi:hypothetical protein